jgi:hypothetical protein
LRASLDGAGLRRDAGHPREPLKRREQGRFVPLPAGIVAAILGDLGIKRQHVAPVAGQDHVRGDARRRVERDFIVRPGQAFCLAGIDEAAL